MKHVYLYFENAFLMTRYVWFWHIINTECKWNGLEIVTNLRLCYVTLDSAFQMVTQSLEQHKFYKRN